MWILAADVAALLAAPGLDALVQRSPGWSAFVTDLCRAAVAGIVVLHVLPHAWHDLGAVAIMLFVAGAAGVVWAERWTPRRDTAVVGWAGAALVAHHLADGVGLALAATEPELGPAVVLHALPVSLVAWRLGVGRGGPAFGWALVGLIVAATVAGFGVGRFGVGLVVEPIAVGVACALGGGLLHALSHVPHDTHHPRASGLGAVVGLVVVAGLAVAEPASGELGPVDTIGRLMVAAGPALLLGLGLAGVATAAGLLRDPDHEELPALVVSVPLLGAAIASLRLALAAAVALSRGPTAPVFDGARLPARAWHAATVTGPDRVLPWFAAGLVLAALLEPLLAPAVLDPVPSAVEVGLLVALGTPFALGAVGLTPIAAVLLHEGVSAGAVLAFLLVGPMTVRSWPDAAVRASAALCVGLLVDAVVPPPATVALHAASAAGPVAWVGAGGVVLLTVASLLRQGAVAFVARVTAPFTHPTSESGAAPARHLH